MSHMVYVRNMFCLMVYFYISIIFVTVRNCRLKYVCLHEISGMEMDYLPWWIGTVVYYNTAYTTT